MTPLCADAAAALATVRIVAALSTRSQVRCAGPQRHRPSLVAHRSERATATHTPRTAALTHRAMLRLATTAAAAACRSSARPSITRACIARSSSIILHRGAISAAPACSCSNQRARTLSTTAAAAAAAAGSSSAAPAPSAVDFANAPSCSATPDPIRTHTCDTVAAAASASSDESAPLILAGWLQSSRGLSDSLWFGVLRDHTGLLQITVDRGALSASLGGPEVDALFSTLKSLSLESVVRVSGTLRARPPAQRNAVQGPNGSLELLLSSLTVLNRAASTLPGGLSLEPDQSLPPAGLPPTPQAASSAAHDEAKLTYRYLELRRPWNQHLLRLRSQIASAVRSSLASLDFTEVETPLLFKSTPEGADEFLVPTRTAGRFYALPQSPQQHKQLLMVAGLPRYFQIARCFRDEGSRADRQPEFTQIDLEMSFVSGRDEIMKTVETMWQAVVEQTLGAHAGADPTRLPAFPLRRMPYSQAMGQYGVDKPDARYELHLHDISAIVAAALPEAPCAPFAAALASGSGSIRALRVPEVARKLSRKDLDAWQKELGPSVLMVRVNKDGELKTPALFHPLFSLPAFRAALATALLGEGGNAATAPSGERSSGGFHADDLLLVVASPLSGVSAATLGRARISAAHTLVSQGLLRLSARQLDQCFWVVDFPLFDVTQQPPTAGAPVSMASIGLSAMHHPFTAPVPEDLPRLLQLLRELSASSHDLGLPIREVPLSSTQLATLRSLRGAHYDLVCNGVELGGGSVRLHDATLQRAVLQMLGAPLHVFAHLLSALSTGAPPHGGLALGMDRVVALIGAAEQERWNEGWMQAQLSAQQPQRATKGKSASSSPSSSSSSSPAAVQSFGLSLPIRDVIAFPKTTSGRDLMVDAPSVVEPAALKQYHIQTTSNASSGAGNTRSEQSATTTAVAK